MISPESKTSVEHTVWFQLGPEECFVVPRRHARGYVSVRYVTVHLMGDRTMISASGSICKKDGTPSAVTSMNESVTLDEEFYWTERARWEVRRAVQP